MKENVNKCVSLQEVYTIGNYYKITYLQTVKTDLM